MVFWLFKKRDDTEERFRNLHDVLKTTFSNVREDIDRLHKWVDSSHEHHNSHRINFKEHELRLLKLENQISLLLDKVLHEEAPEKEEYEGDKDEIEELLPKKISQNEIFSSLTKTQLDLFKTIYQIQKQTNTNKVSLRSVAKIHYPEKDYSSVRSTISDYLTILSAWGLIKKQRVGKESFVAVSDHGLDLVSESNIKQKKKKLKAKRKN
ncbi:hypothetical protein J4413_02410 [Candidatus Woesearchaeota archaeon]|nr:hypothetical protein [Candidatus Woesearchaeota archaeon]